MPLERSKKENQAGLKLNGTHGLLVYADVSLFGDNVNTIKKNREAPIDASKDVSREVNAVKTKFMLPAGHQNEG
jgi:hypothetical protein